MDGYNIITLQNMMSELGEEQTQSILSNFSCPCNGDVQNFLRQTACVFNKQGISKTHLVFVPYKGEPTLVGYFALALKTIRVPSYAVKSQSLRKRLGKFSMERNLMPTHPKDYTIPAPLIAQLSKNYTNNYNELISGEALIGLAFREIKKIQVLAGSKFVYLECEDKQSLTDFYSKHGFVNFGKRQLDRCEKETQSGEYLIQMLKYMSD